LWRDTFRVVRKHATYHWIKGYCASLIVSNIKMVMTILTRMIRILERSISNLKPFILGLRDGIKYGYELKKIGLELDIYKCPLLKRNFAIL